MALTNSWIEQLPLKKVLSCKEVHGGDTNKAYQVKTPEKSYFMKVQPNNPASYFDHEQRGLKEMGGRLVLILCIRFIMVRSMVTHIYC